MEITCINCPVGCRMQVTVENGQVTRVEGNGCLRGLNYARQECVAPQRMVTAAVTVCNRKTPVSVKTRTPISKEKIFDCIQALKTVEVRAPVHIGDIILKNVAGLGVDLVATKNVESR